jgi:hypothetical protein
MKLKSYGFCHYLVGKLFHLYRLDRSRSFSEETSQHCYEKLRTAVSFDIVDAKYILAERLFYGLEYDFRDVNSGDRKTTLKEAKTLLNDVAKIQVDENPNVDEHKMMKAATDTSRFT